MTELELHIRFEDIRIVSRQLKHVVENIIKSVDSRVAYSEAKDISKNGFVEKITDKLGNEIIRFHPGHRIVNIEIHAVKAKPEESEGEAEGDESGT